MGFTRMRPAGGQHGRRVEECGQGGARRRALGRRGARRAPAWLDCTAPVPSSKVDRVPSPRLSIPCLPAAGRSYMAWFILARLAVYRGGRRYSAFMLRPLGADRASTSPSALVLALLSVVFEMAAPRHRRHPHARRAARRRDRPAARQGHQRRAVLGRHGDQRVAFLHSFILLVLAVPRRSSSAAARASGSSRRG